MSKILNILEFITKPGCHLCDDALPLVLRAAEQRGLAVVERSVLDDDDLMGRYGLRIPVVLSGGVVVVEGVIDTAMIEAGLAGLALPPDGAS